MIILSTKDTHKLWQAMQVLLFGTMELLQEYRRVEGKETFCSFWRVVGRSGM